jgi:hypothetical protein
MGIISGFIDESLDISAKIEMLSSGIQSWIPGNDNNTTRSYYLYEGPWAGIRILTNEDSD